MKKILILLLILITYGCSGIHLKGHSLIKAVSGKTLISYKSRGKLYFTGGNILGEEKYYESKGNYKVYDDKLVVTWPTPKNQIYKRGNLTIETTFALNYKLVKQEKNKYLECSQAKDIVECKNNSEIWEFIDGDAR